MTGLLRRGAAWGALVLLLSIVAVAAFDWHRFQQELQQRQALLARVIAEGAERSLHLAALSGAQTGLRLMEGAQGAPEFNRQLRTALAYQGEVRALALVDREGRVLASTEESDIGMLLPLKAWREAFSVTRPDAWLGPVLRARRLADLQGGPVPQGRELLPLVQAIGPPDLGWSLITQFNPERFANLQLQTLKGQPDAVSVLMRLEGQALASAAPLEPQAQWAALPPQTQYLPAQESGEWRGDGVRPGHQFAAFRLLRGWPVISLVETRRSDALAAWWGQSGGLLLTSALAGLLLIAALLLAARVQSGREHALAQRDLARVDASQREEQLQVVVESLQEAVFRTDAQGHIAYASAQIERLTGRSAEAWLGKPVQHLAAPPQRAKVERLLHEEGGTGASRLLLSRPDWIEGVPQHLDLSLRVLWRDGQRQGFAGSLGDASGRVQAQRSLEAQLSFLEQEMEVSPLPTSVTDLQRRYVFVNQAWETFFGRERADVLGARVGDALEAAERAQHEAMDQELIASGRPLRYEARLRSADGQQRDVVVLKMLLLGNAQQGARIVAKLFDVTELRDAERITREARDAAEQASQLKSEFIANISHELRTPLQSIIGFSELGMVRAVQHPKLQAMFEDVHGAGLRMLRLVNDLLDVAKLDKQAGAVELRDADAAPLIQAVARELQPLLAARDLQLRLELPQHALLLKADPPRLQQVLRNLMANAIKFSPPGASVCVRAARLANELRIEVDDEGPGIPPDELESIFEAFTQSSRTKDGSGGSGLGLTISRKIAQGHGGRLWAENRSGAGARFVLVLP